MQEPIIAQNQNNFQLIYSLAWSPNVSLKVLLLIFSFLIRWVLARAVHQNTTYPMVWGHLCNQLHHLTIPD